MEKRGSMTRPTKIFFMHVAKTAGSYVNDVFIKSLGADNCFVHCEEKMQDASVFREMLAEKIFVSGHVYYHDWLRLSGDLNSEFLKITLVRNPMKHLKSHLLFFNNYNLPELRERFRLRGPVMNQVLDQLSLTSLNRVLDQLSLVDFANPFNISKFMESLSPLGIELFNNCQSRYFLSTKVCDPHMPLNRHHEQLILLVLQQFDLIGLSENPASFLTEAERLSGIKLNIHDEIINKTVSGPDIDLNNDIVRDVFERNSEVDEFLYTAVLQHTARAYHACVAELRRTSEAAHDQSLKAEQLILELKSQLSSSDEQLDQSAAELDILRAELAHRNAEQEAMATSLPWRIARTLGRFGVRTGPRATSNGA
jgi:hypothetical protein